MVVPIVFGVDSTGQGQASGGLSGATAPLPPARKRPLLLGGALRVGRPSAGGLAQMNVTSQLDVLRELSEVKAQYEEQLGWQVSLDVGHHRLVMPVGWTVDAVTMPARLAVIVAAQLRIALVTAPTIAAPGGQWLTFLTAPATRLNLPPELRPARVQLVPRGGQVIVPASFDAHHDAGTWQWVEPPRPHLPLPPWSSVIVATRLAVA